jgi:hypothetical protein
MANLGVIKPRKIKWAGHVAQVREMKNAYKNVVENLNGQDYLKNIDIHGRIILKCRGTGVRQVSSVSG